MQEQPPTIKEGSPEKDAASTAFPKHDGSYPTMLDIPEASKAKIAVEGKKKGNTSDRSLRGKGKRQKTARYREFLEQIQNHLDVLRFQEGTADAPFPATPDSTEAPQLRKTTSSEELWRKFGLFRKGVSCWTASRSTFRTHIKIPPEKRPFAQAENYEPDQGYPPLLCESENLALLIEEKNELIKQIEEFGKRGWSAKLPPDFETPSSDFGVIRSYRQGEPPEHWE